MWAAYHQGQPIRVPMLLTSVQRIWVQDPALNRHRFTWQDYLTRPEVMYEGGVPAADLLNRTPEEITQRTRLILQSGILRGGRFILKEANDLPPCVPLQNMEAMYAA